MLVTIEQLEQAILDSSDRRRMQVLNELNESMRLAYITSPLRIAAFIAVLAYHSENLHVLPYMKWYFNQWEEQQCNSLADVGSISAIEQRIAGDLKSIADVKANYERCKKVFNVN